MSSISNDCCLPTCSTTMKTGLILDWRRTRQQVVQQKFALRVKTRFNPFRDSAGCTIAMRWQRRRANSSETLLLETRTRHRASGVLRLILGEPTLFGQFERFDSCSPGPGRVTIRDDVYGYPGLLLPLVGHPGADLLYEPLLKSGARLNRSSADDQRVGVKGVDHLVEKQPQGVRLHSEHFPAEPIAPIRHAAHELRQFMAWVTRQKIRQDVPLNGRQRTQRLEVPDAPAVARRPNPAHAIDALIGNQHMTEFAAKSVFPFHHIPVENDSAAIARPDDDGNGSLAAVCAENRIVPP